MTFGWNQCRMCGRHLSSEEDPFSGDCGGDCWGCVGFIEAEIGYEPSQEAVRREIEAGLRETAAALNLRLLLMLARPVPGQELGAAPGRMIRQPREDVGKPPVWWGGTLGPNWMP